MNHQAAAGAGILMLMSFFAAGFAFFITWIVSLIDVIKNDFQKDSDKTMWLFLLVLIAPLGTILYQMFGKNQKRTKKPFTGLETGRRMY